MKYIPPKMKKIMQREGVTIQAKTLEEFHLVNWLFQIGCEVAPYVPTDQGDYDPLVEGSIPRLRVRN